MEQDSLIIQQLTGDLTLHQVITLTISGIGTIINLAAILLIIKGGFHHQKSFTFVLNLFVGNFLMCFVGFAVYITPTFSPVPRTDIFCPFSGYIIFALSGTSLFNIVLISFNRYVLIVRHTYFDRIYSTRNTGIILAASWSFLPVLYLLPLFEVWGSFQFDNRRLVCNPWIDDDGFAYFALGLISLIAFPSITFCYIEIIRKIRSSNTRMIRMQSDNAERLKNERQLVRSVLVMISVFGTLTTPFAIVCIVDPKMELLSLWFHQTCIYIGCLSFVINTLVYSVLTTQIRSTFLHIWGRLFKTERSETS